MKSTSIKIDWYESKIDESPDSVNTPVPNNKLISYSKKQIKFLFQLPGTSPSHQNDTSQIFYNKFKNTKIPTKYNNAYIGLILGSL